ncbi:MAG: hypothetical protein JW839_18050 [Candidatus Lokiarchaeota archaeon]|nr:hypothetical protein [Candidatus Lokiarchaeota archaeon]
MVAEAKSRGGIVIPHMMLQVHKNGAKFPISKIYVDDEQLDPNQAYTLVIIPEGPRLEGIVLTYFDRKLGPAIIGTYPASLLNAEVQETCINWFDMRAGPGFFSASSGTITGLNYYFEVINPRMPGGKDSVLLTLLVNSKPSILIEDIVSNTLAEQAEKLSNDLTLFRALYADVEAGTEKHNKDEMTAAKNRVLGHLPEVKAALDDALEIQEKLDVLESGKKLADKKSTRE